MSMPANGGKGQAPPDKKTKWTAFQAIVGFVSLLIAILALYNTKVVADKQSATAEQALKTQRDQAATALRVEQLTATQVKRGGAHLTVRLNRAWVQDYSHSARTDLYSAGGGSTGSLDLRTLTSGLFYISGTVSNIGQSPTAISDFGLGTDPKHWVIANPDFVYCRLRDSEPWTNCAQPLVLPPGSQWSYAFSPTLDQVRRINPDWRKHGTEVCVKASGSDSDSEVGDCETFPLFLPSLSPAAAQVS